MPTEEVYPKSLMFKVQNSIHYSISRPQLVPTEFTCLSNRYIEKVYTEVLAVRTSGTRMHSHIL